MVQQVTSIFAGINGSLDDVPVELCRDFERELMPVPGNAPQCDRAEDHCGNKQITEETESQLRSAIETLKSNFLSRAGAA